MSDLLVIAICGKARAGKDTIASHLVQRHGFFRVGLADGVRAALTDLDGPTWELRKHLESHAKTIRWGAQTLGTESRFAIADAGSLTGPINHWSDLALIKIDFMSTQIPDGRKRFVIPDMRFPYESNRLSHIIERWGGRFQAWKVLREGSGLSGAEATHESETSIESIQAEATIHNSGSISRLLTSIDTLAEFYV